MDKKRFLKWARTSALGNVALFELIGLVPISLMYLGLFYSDGTLTLNWAIYTVFLCFACLALAALLYWYTVARLLQKLGHKANRGRP